MENSPRKKRHLTSSVTGPDDGVASLLLFGGVPLHHSLNLNLLARPGARGVRLSGGIASMRLAALLCFLVLMLIHSGCAPARPLSDAWKIPILDLQAPETQISVPLSATQDFGFYLLVSKGTAYFNINLAPVDVSAAEGKYVICLVELLREPSNFRNSKCITSRVLCVGNCSGLSSKDLQAVPLKYFPASLFSGSRIVQLEEIHYSGNSIMATRKDEMNYAHCGDKMSFKSRQGAQYFLSVTALRSEPPNEPFEISVSLKETR